ncbi:CRISPR-associated helicase/endonuclease Cas3 [Clostridium beijerinckii]|uniref:CRISPR-associated helicase/endonuclease Cas3 n=1 Tax=Clostridium beijerinckii TaxID=1520 RepID=UPI000566AD7E|nr:CRISPR-associated helicase/endonuclease Cas3 [Clostridium beijerinckii]
MSEIVAKVRKDGKTQNLNEHTFMVVEEALKLINEDDLNFISQKTNWNNEKIRDLIFLISYFHDIGKSTEEFQSTIADNKKSYHSLYSASLFSDITEFHFDKDNEINMLMLCILTHHSIFNDASSFKAVGNNKKFNFKFLPYAETFFYNYKELYKEYMGTECHYKFTYKNIRLKDLGEEIEIMYVDIHDINNKKKYEKLRVLYSYVLGIINLADWIASAKFNESMTSIEFKDLISKEEMFTKLAKYIKIEKFIPKAFQQQLSVHKGSILVEIPTGEGKTEGAFLWAINNLKNSCSKIIYTLPTQTTSNKLYERASNIFGDNTGLMHSTSKIYLEKKYEIENALVDDKFKNDILFCATFSKGMTVSTIDSLFKYFLNIGRYNVAMFNFLRSIIIIDEVHSYDFKLMGFIKRFLEICNSYEVPVCLMSASLPNKMKKLLDIDKFPIIKEESLFDKKANHIYKVEDSLDNNLSSIIDKFYEGKNVLVVRNNVKKSVETFKNLTKDKKINVVLYNSQFKKKDRIKKEDEIYDKLKNKEAFILVATQVVEISLDIDFEVMYTDNAPIDSLIQRFGRVNRKKRTDSLGEIFIFKNADIRPYYSRMLEITYEIIEEGVFPLSKYTEWLNSVYDKLFNDKIVINELEIKFKEGYDKFDKTIDQLFGISKSEDLYDLRDIKYYKKDYILVEDYNENDFKHENTISLPTYLERGEYFLKEKDYSNELYYDVLNLDYTYDLGVILTDDRLIY